MRLADVGPTVGPVSLGAYFWRDGLQAWFASLRTNKHDPSTEILNKNSILSWVV